MQFTWKSLYVILPYNSILYSSTSKGCSCLKHNYGIMPNYFHATFPVPSHLEQAVVGMLFHFIWFFFHDLRGWTAFLYLSMFKLYIVLIVEVINHIMPRYVKGVQHFDSLRVFIRHAYEQYDAMITFIQIVYRTLGTSSPSGTNLLVNSL